MISWHVMLMALCMSLSCAIANYFLFCKQKTAYEMRISDCSSDVCSSDLPRAPRGEAFSKALADWQTLRSDPGAVFDREVVIDASRVRPTVTWGRSEERRVGKECVSKCRSRWSPYP